MIKEGIRLSYDHQFLTIKDFVDDLHIADYTEQTKADVVKRSVEFHSPIGPVDIKHFSIENPFKLDISGIEFDNSSFTCGNGNPRSQCESVIFPTESNESSWVLFCELKYSLNPSKNKFHLTKAIKQLYKTRYYYYQNGIVNFTNTSYLVASIPAQKVPFANFTISPSNLSKLKRKRNIVLKLINKITINSEQLLG
ncbi:hypothetical protein [Myroides guanonis]|uniref:Uncharacterized protein n=1 Tax=Myroides guanonis TaxID=1150112 RepID=A0A1I3U058_9FLAO|nr:hypothetical protein [Myroides guanonis]SFJ76938.1 hypothetical protein SAMN04487893_11596 [Myroides guanonis]